MSRLKLFVITFSILASTISCNRTNEKEVTFTEDIQPIITTNCTNRGCHLGTEQFSLLTYEDVIKNGYIVEANPKEVVLYQYLTKTDVEYRMPPIPFPPLKDEELKLISDWIKQGGRR